MSSISILFNSIYQSYRCFRDAFRTKLRLRKQLRKNSYILKKLFNNDLSVRYGPFAGMNYINLITTGSQLLPKILGSYEEPIQYWIEDILAKPYKTIVDVGCAEGYYAVGFATKLSDITVYAYDLDRAAIQQCRELIILNNVSDKVVVGELFETKELEKIYRKDSNFLLFCDIEGAEKDLLNVNTSPLLKYIDIIVEAHDFIYPGITELLVGRFKDSHNIDIIEDYTRNSTKYPILKENNKFNIEVLDEKRPSGMKWLRMISILDNSY